MGMVVVVGGALQARFESLQLRRTPTVGTRWSNAGVLGDKANRFKGLEGAECFTTQSQTKSCTARRRLSVSRQELSREADVAAQKDCSGRTSHIGTLARRR